MSEWPSESWPTANELVQGGEYGVTLGVPPSHDLAAMEQSLTHNQPHKDAFAVFAAMARLTAEMKVEIAWVRRKTAKYHLVAGDKGAVTYPRMTDAIIAHSHPAGAQRLGANEVKVFNRLERPYACLQGHHWLVCLTGPNSWRLLKATADAATKKFDETPAVGQPNCSAQALELIIEAIAGLPK